METARYAAIPDEVRGRIIDYFALKAESVRGYCLNKTQAELDTLHQVAESPQPQSLWRRIVRCFARVIGELPAEVQMQQAEESVIRASSTTNHFDSLVTDAQEGRVDRIEAELLKDVEYGFDSLRMRGAGWSPDEDYSGWRRVRLAGYNQASEAINLLSSINPSRALLRSVDLEKLAKECLSPNYD